VLTAIVDGTLQADGNTMFVSSISNPFYNGAPAPALPFVDSVSHDLGGPGLLPQLTLDGTQLDLIACTTTTGCVDAFAFDVVYKLYGAPAFFSGPAFGSTLEPYFITSYSLTPTPAPLPGALPLFATGLGALGLLGWRRKKKAVPFAA
jgi:hypothetical protein